MDHTPRRKAPPQIQDVNRLREIYNLVVTFNTLHPAEKLERLESHLIEVARYRRYTYETNRLQMAADEMENSD